MIRLSKNFTLAECARSSTAERCGLENAPPAHLIPKIKAVAENILQPVRDHYGKPIVFNGGLSWYRGPQLNSFLKGAEESQHCKGEAVDIELPGVANLALAHWIKDNLVFDQLLLEFYREDDPSAGWVHVSYVEEDRRNETLTIGRDKTGARFTMSGLPFLSA